MIVAVTIALVLYVVQRAMYGTQLTPDGGFYLAMGRGAFVPRPYSLRLLPRVIKSARAWGYVQLFCYVGSVALASLCVEALGFNYVAQIAGGLAVAVLPMMRRTITWPVLLDAPLLFVCLLSAYVALVFPPFVVPLVIGLSWLVHERGPLLSALYAAPYLPVPALIIVGCLVVVLALITYWIYRTREPHSAETTIDWLRNPLEAARVHHAPVLYDWRVWLLPWGGLLVGFAGLSVWGWITVALCYAMCAVAIDRVRIYQMSVFPLIVGLLAIAPPYAVLPLVVLTWFTNTKEV